MIKAIKSLSRCHVAVIIIDASEGITEQDLRICSYALEQNRGIVLVANKWDIVKEDLYRKGLFSNEMERKLRHLTFAPRIHVSALTGEGVMKIFDRIDLVYRDFVTRIPTAAVNRALQEIVERHPHPRLAQGTLKFAYATEVKTSPPTFVLFVNRPDKVTASYQRYLINQFRKYFNIPHAPVNIILKKKGHQLNKQGKKTR
jgi:GTP-binding protein